MQLWPLKLLLMQFITDFLSSKQLYLTKLSQFFPVTNSDSKCPLDGAASLKLEAVNFQTRFIESAPPKHLRSNFKTTNLITSRIVPRAYID